MLFEEFEDTKHAADAAGLFVRASGRYPLTAFGDINTYAIFAETFLDLTRPRGRSGLIVPTGILSDDTTKVFFQNLTSTHRLYGAISFENEEFLFSGIANVVRYTLLTMLGTGEESHQATYAFYIRRAEQINEAERYFALSPKETALLNPNTHTCPIFRSKYDAELTKQIYRRVPILIDEAKGEAGNPWRISFLRMFDMANDSSLFREPPWLAEHGGELHDMIWYMPDREQYFPLYEAKFAWHYDHRFSSYHNYGKAKGRGGRGLPPVTIEEYADPHFRVQPRYWVNETNITDRVSSVGWQHKWLLGWRDVTSAKLERTFVSTVIPKCAVGDKFLLMFPGQDPQKITALLANLCSIPFDYITRQKIGGIAMKYFTAKQLPVFPPEKYSTEDFDFIMPRVLEMAYTAWDMKPFAEDLGYDGPPFPWHPERRAILQAELDAYFARLYGLTREELRYILDPADIMGPHYPSETFRVLKERELSQCGEYRTQRLVLEAWDRLG